MRNKHNSLATEVIVCSSLENAGGSRSELLSLVASSTRLKSNRTDSYIVFKEFWNRRTHIKELLICLKWQQLLKTVLWFCSHDVNHFNIQELFSATELVTSSALLYAPLLQVLCLHLHQFKYCILELYTLLMFIAICMLITWKGSAIKDQWFQTKSDEMCKTVQT